MDTDTSTPKSIYSRMRRRFFSIQNGQRNSLFTQLSQAENVSKKFFTPERISLTLSRKVSLGREAEDAPEIRSARDSPRGRTTGIKKGEIELIDHILENHQLKVILNKKPRGSMYIDELWNKRYKIEVRKAIELTQLYDEIQRTSSTGISKDSGNVSPQATASEQNEGDNSTDKNPSPFGDLHMRLTGHEISKNPLKTKGTSIKVSTPLVKRLSLPPISSPCRKSFTERNHSSPKRSNFANLIEESYVVHGRHTRRISPRFPQEKSRNHRLRDKLLANANNSVNGILGKCDDLVHDSQIPQMLKSMASSRRSSPSEKIKRIKAKLVERDTIEAVQRVLNVRKSLELAYPKTPRNH